MPQKGDSTVQSLNKVVAVVVYDSCPLSRRAAVAFTDKVVDIPGSEQWKVPQIQSSTELNDDFEAGLAHFSDSPERG